MPMKSLHLSGKPKLRSVLIVAVCRVGLIVASTLAASLSLPVCAQQANPASPVVVQPGAPGQPTRTLPPSTRATLPPSSAKDVEFMKGMIMHHGGALVMVKDLFDTAGAGQDAELFNFTTDVDSGQRAEIRIMQNMLQALPTE